MTDTSNKPSGSSPVFFLSYPRPAATERSLGADRDYVAFFHDLCAALTRFVPLDLLHGLGALSPEWNGAGGESADDAARNIAECDVFVPLHSPRYFENQACGKELAAFESRVRRAGKSPSDAILPVLWAPVSPQWDVSQPPPYRSGQTAIDDEYLLKGLFWLQEARPADYRRVVADLARRIADISAGRPVGHGPAADLTSLPSSLHKAELQPLVVVILAPAGGRPPGTGRPQYGGDVAEWAPFAVEAAAPLIDSLVALARRKGWDPEVVPFSDTDPRLFGTAEPDRQVVLVVDPRALDDERWRSALERFDRLDKPWIGVVAAYDPAAAPPEEQERLKALLLSVLDRKYARRSPSLRVNAPIATSLRTFDQALDATANDTRIRLANHLLNRASSHAEEENAT